MTGVHAKTQYRRDADATTLQDNFTSISWSSPVRPARLGCVVLGKAPHEGLVTPLDCFYVRFKLEVFL